MWGEGGNGGREVGRESVAGGGGREGGREKLPIETHEKQLSEQRVTKRPRSMVS